MKTLHTRRLQAVGYVRDIYVRDQEVLVDEIVCMLDMYGALTSSRLALLIGGSRQLIEQALADLAAQDVVALTNGCDREGQPYRIWSTCSPPGTAGQADGLIPDTRTPRPARRR